MRLNEITERMLLYLAGEACERLAREVGSIAEPNQKQ